jgi:TldD protein
MASIMKDGKDVAEYCVEVGQNLGCSYVEARYVRDLTRGLAFRNGEPVSGGFSPTEGIGVRVLADGNMGFATFDRLEKNLAKESITTACRMAKNAKRKTPIDLGEPVANKAKWRMAAKEPLNDVDIDTMIEFTSELNKQMAGLASYVVMFNPRVIDKYIVTNEGTQIEGQQSYILLYTILTAQAPGGSEQKFMDLTLAGGWERIKESNLIENVKTEVENLKRAA